MKPIFPIVSFTTPMTRRDRVDVCLITGAIILGIVIVSACMLWLDGV